MIYMHIRLHALVDSDAEGAHIECHNTCYCSYTSKQNVVKYMAKIRKEGFSSPGTEPPVTRVRRSQLPTFQVKKNIVCFVEMSVYQKIPNTQTGGKVLYNVRLVIALAILPQRCPFRYM